MTTNVISSKDSNPTRIIHAKSDNIAIMKLQKLCFQYAITIALNHEAIKSHPKIKSNIKPFIDQYDWKETNFLSDKKRLEQFWKNSKTIALNILYVPCNIEEIRDAYTSKHN